MKAAMTGELFNVYVKGLIAKMYMVRGVVPNAATLEMLQSKEFSPRLREVANIAVELGFSPEFSLEHQSSALKEEVEEER